MFFDPAVLLVPGAPYNQIFAEQNLTRIMKIWLPIVPNIFEVTLVGNIVFCNYFQFSTEYTAKNFLSNDSNVVQ